MKNLLLIAILAVGIAGKFELALGTSGETNYNSISPLVFINEVAKRHYAIKTGYPVISTAVPDGSIDVAIYISPSCPTCIRLYASLVIKGFLFKDKALGSSNVSFLLVPRVDNDHSIIKNLFCVEPKAVVAAVSSYYKAAFDLISTKGNFDSAALEKLTKELIAISSDIARSFGVPGTALEQCQSDKSFDLAIALTWKHGWNQNIDGDWPLIVIDGQPTAIKNSIELMEVLKGLKK